MLNNRGIRSGACLGAVLGMALFANRAGLAADVSTDSLKFAPGVEKAAGYEAPARLSRRQLDQRL